MKESLSAQCYNFQTLALQLRGQNAPLQTPVGDTHLAKRLLGKLGHHRSSSPVCLLGYLPAKGNSGPCPKEPLIELLRCPSSSAPQVALPWHHGFSFPPAFSSTQATSTTRASLNRHSATTITPNAAFHTRICSGTAGDGTRPPSTCHNSRHTDGHDSRHQRWGAVGSLGRVPWTFCKSCRLAATRDPVY